MIYTCLKLQGGSVNASQSSTRKEIPHGSTQERVKSQMLAKQLKRVNIYLSAYLVLLLNI
jgi:hypothetical protein